MLKLAIGAVTAAAVLVLAVPFVFVASLGASAPGCDGSAEESIPEAYAPLVHAAAERHGLPPSLLAGLIRAESGWDASARSAVGAGGLTQLMPATARAVGVTDVSDPGQAIDGGARYLAAQLEAFGDLELALAAYNAGPGAVRAHRGVPPFAETRAYVPRVLGYATAYGGQLMPCEGAPGGPWGGYRNGEIPASALAPIGGGHALRPDAAAAFLEMSAAHRRRFGRPIGVTDSYRSLAGQIDVARRKPGLAAEPGTSRHGWGLAVDLVTGGWDGTTMRWLEGNAARYGWTHPEWARRDGSKPEHWHWEFVGASGG